MVVHIREASAVKDRDVMLSPKLLEALRVYWRGLRRKPTDWLFRQPMAHGKFILSRPRFFGQLRARCTRAGLEHKHIHPHTLRSLFCHPSARRPAADLRTIQMLLRSSGPRGDDDLIASLRRHLSAPAVAGCTYDQRRRRTDTERMNRPPLEVADIVRCAGQSFIERSRKWINGQHERCCWPSHAAATARWVDIAISARTADILPSRITRAATGIAQVQGNARLRWLQARERELLPTHYVTSSSHSAGTRCPRIAANKRLIYNLLFHAKRRNPAEIARDPRHLGAEIGFFSVLHTWDQRLQHHPHVHCVVAAGGLAPDHAR